MCQSKKKTQEIQSFYLNISKLQSILISSLFYNFLDLRPIEDNTEIS